MGNDTTVLTGFDKLEVYLKNLENKLDRPDELTRGITGYMEESTTQKLREGRIRGPKTSAFTLSVRRGSGGISLVDNARLVQSITSTDKAVGTDIIYGPIHNRGGIIRAKQAKFLAIPATTEAKTLSDVKGVRGALEILKRKGYKIWTTKGAIRGKKGTRGKPKVLFYLKKQVTIPKQEFLYIDDADWENIKEEVRFWLKS